jgi:hypothetical protein
MIQASEHAFASFYRDRVFDLTQSLGFNKSPRVLRFESFDKSAKTIVGRSKPALGGSLIVKGCSWQSGGDISHPGLILLRMQSMQRDSFLDESDNYCSPRLSRGI